MLMTRVVQAKLARYRAELLEPDRKSGRPGEGFEVAKAGLGRVCVFPPILTDFAVGLNMH